MLSLFLSKYGKWGFYLLALIQIASVWQYDYFLTTDGPAHVANAKVLRDLFLGLHTEFYTKYYDLHLTFFPNWTTHIVLAALLLFFKPMVAEKILVSAYVLLFCFSYRAIVARLSGISSLTASIGVFFAFHYLLYYGFYNYSISIALALLFVAVWKECCEQPIWKQWIVLIPLAVILTLTHIFSWFISAVILGSYFTASSLITHSKYSTANLLTNFRQRWMVVSVVSLCSVTFCCVYMLQNTGETQYYKEDFVKQWETISSLKMLMLWQSPQESRLIQFITILILSLSALQIFYRIGRRQTVLPGDAWLLVAVSITCIYFIQPKFLCLAGFWSPRMAWLAWLALAAWVAGYAYGDRAEATTFILTLLILIALKYCRLQHEEKSHEALNDYLSAMKYISEGATLLPLSYAHFGADTRGMPINNWRKQFLHAFDYCGAEKAIINFANYEAVTPWFPLNWKTSCNPAACINKGNGIEASPPDAYLTPAVSDSCNAQPDYVVTWCMNFADSTTAEWKSMDRQLRENFKQRYVSASGRTIVWKRR